MRVLHLLACALFSLALATQALAQGSSKTAVRSPVVNGKVIPMSKIIFVTNAWIEKGYPDNDKTRAAVISQLILEELLVQEARDSGFEISNGKKSEIRQQVQDDKGKGLIKASDVELYIDMAERNFLRETFLKDYERKIRNFNFQQNAMHRNGDNIEYKFRHILVEKESDARSIIAQLRSNAKFEDLVKRSLDTGTRDKGGALNWAPVSALLGPIGEALVKLKKGEIAEAPVRTELGWHIIKLDDVRDLRKAVEVDIQDALKALFAGLYSKAKIE